MTTAAAAPNAPTPENAEAQTVEPASADAPATAPAKRPEIKKVSDFRALIRAQRERIEARSNGIASDRDQRVREGRPPETTQRKNEREAKEAKEAKGGKSEADEPEESAKPAAKAETKPKAKDGERDVKPDNKPEGRDEHGRFAPKEGAADKPSPAAAADKPKDAPAPAQDKPVADAKPDPKPAPEPEPVRPAAKEESGLASKYARLQLDTAKKDAELVTLRERAAAAEKWEKLAARVRGPEIDEDALEQFTGRSWEKLIRDVIEEESGVKFKAKTRLPPEMQRIQDELEQTLKSAKDREEAVAKKQRDEESARAAAAEQERQTTVRKQEAEMVRGMLDKDADKYPLSASIPGMPERIVQAFYQRWANTTFDPNTGRSTFDPRKKPTEESVLESMEASLIPQVSAIVSTERGLRALFQDAKTRELALQILGADKAPPSQPKTSPSQRSDKGNQANADGPRTLSNKVTQDAPVDPSKPRTPEEKRARQIEELRKWRAQNGRA